MVREEGPLREGQGLAHGAGPAAGRERSDQGREAAQEWRGEVRLRFAAQAALLDGRHGGKQRGACVGGAPAGGRGRRSEDGGLHGGGVGPAGEAAMEGRYNAKKVEGHVLEEGGARATSGVGRGRAEGGCHVVQQGVDGGGTRGARAAGGGCCAGAEGEGPVGVEVVLEVVVFGSRDV
jgi:hypothetical protein